MAREIYLDYYGTENKHTIWLKCFSEEDPHRTIVNVNREDISRNIEQEIAINDDIFNELFQQLIELDIKSVLEGNHQDKDIDDGANIDIGFGGEFNKIHYELWGVHRNNMENKNIKELCKVVKEILEISGIPKEEYESDL
jgi:hypothetical protein